MRSTATLKGFSRGLGVVKGEGVAAAKKALPFPLKKEKFKFLSYFKNFKSAKIKINSKFKFSKTKILVKIWNVKNGVPRLRGFRWVKGV